MLKGYEQLMENLRNNGLSYREIAKTLEEDYGFKVSYQANGKRFKKKEKMMLEASCDTKREVERILGYSNSVKEAHKRLTQYGYDISYYKVLRIAKEIEVRRSKELEDKSKE